MLQNEKSPTFWTEISVSFFAMRNCTEANNFRRVAEGDFQDYMAEATMGLMGISDQNEILKLQVRNGEKDNFYYALDYELSY